MTAKPKRRITVRIDAAIESDSDHEAEAIANAFLDEVRFWVPTVPVQNQLAGAVTQVSVVRFDEQPQSPEVI